MAHYDATSDRTAVVIRCYEELNDFLPPQRRKRDIRLAVSLPAPVRHIIETLGVPHTEVELILVNGASVGLEHPLHDGDRVSVYPRFESLDVTPLLRLRDRPLRETRFVADAHLGALARGLRLLGFDTLFRNDFTDAAIVQVAEQQRRIVLTRDRRLLMRRTVTHGLYLHALRPKAQLHEVIQRLDLRRSAHPFIRCLRCNALLEAVDKQVVVVQLEPDTARSQQRFWRCTGCGRFYWQGSHYRRMRRLVQELLGPSMDWPP